MGCDGQQLRVPLPAVWRPLGSRPGTQPAKVTSLQLSLRKKTKKTLLVHIVCYTSTIFSNIKKPLTTSEPTQKYSSVYLRNLLKSVLCV